MDFELERTSSQIKNATKPEDIFGELNTLSVTSALAEGQVLYRRLVKIVHPDKYTDTTEKRLAEAAFKGLQALWEQAEAYINAGTYGKNRTPIVVIETKTASYHVGEKLAEGDIANIYACLAKTPGGNVDAVFKVARMPGDNDLLAQEGKALKILMADDKRQLLRPFVSSLIDSFSYKEKDTGIMRQANVLTKHDGFYNLVQLRNAFPDGLDTKHMAWIFRRLLVAIDFHHLNDLVHGAVLPEHVMVHPEMHGLVLIDQSYSVHQPDDKKTPIKAISDKYRDWYPKEVFAKEPPMPGLDLYMAAKTMLYLVGGDPATGNLPDSVDPKAKRVFGAFFRGCTFDNPRMRPQDAGALRKEFTELIERLWGPRKFHELRMPAR